jgi:tape measure domain-containing protein
VANIARLGIVIDPTAARRGASQTNDAIDSMASTAKRAQDSITRALGSIGVALGVRELVRYADTWREVEGRLQLVTRSATETARIQRELFTIAQESRTAFEATADLYTKIARNSQNLGLSQAETARLTQAVSAAVRVSGASAATAAAGITQFGQALASGRLQGDELRSVLENLPRLAEALGQGLGVSIGKLREMGEQGKLTADVVARALLPQMEKLREEAGALPVTIGQALIVLNNSLGGLIAGADGALSATEAVAGAIVTFSKFIDENRAAVSGLATALGTAGLIGVLVKVGAALRALAITQATVALLGMVPAVKSVADAMALLSLAASATWKSILGPVGLVVAGLTAVAGAYAFLRMRAKEAAQATAEVSKPKGGDSYSFIANSATTLDPQALTQLNRQTENARAALDAFNRGGRQSAEAFKAAAAEWDRSAKSSLSFADALKRGDAGARALLVASRDLTAAQGRLATAGDAGKAAQERMAKGLAEAASRAEDAVAQVTRAIDEQAAAEARLVRSRAAAQQSTDRMIGGLVREIQQTAALIEAKQAGEEAYRRATRAMAQDDAVRAERERRQAAGIELTKTEEKEIRALVGKLLDLRDALEGTGNSGAKAAADETGRLADALRDVLGLGQGISAIFGEQARGIGQILTGAQSLVGALERARELGKFTKDGVAQDVGFTGALSGKAGAAGVVGALGTIGAVAGTIVTVADALDLFGTRARERAREMAEAAVAFNRALDEFANGANRTDLERALTDNARRAEELIRQAAKASGAEFSGSFDNIGDIRAYAAALADVGARLGDSRFGNLLREFAVEIDRIAAAAEANTARIRDAEAAAQRQREQSLAARAARAAGRGGEADLIELIARQAEETRQAARFGEEYVVALRAVQAAELAAAQAAQQRAAEERARRSRDAETDLAGREARLRGDDRGATRADAEGRRSRALDEARDLFEAGTISAEVFERLVAVINGEFLRAMDDYEKALAEQAAALARARAFALDDLEIRRIAATQGAEAAEVARRELEWRRELANITDPIVRAQAEYVQGLEREAILKAQAAEMEKRRQEQNRAIDVEILRAGGRTAEADALALRIERERRLAEAIDEATRKRLEELFALQDQAAATQALVDARQREIEKAERLASITADVEELLARAEGRTFDADQLRINRDIDRRIEEARNAGAGADVIAQLERVRRLQLDALIAKFLDQGGATETGGATAERNAGALRDVGSVTEASAIRLIDYAASQLVVLREIAANTRGMAPRATPAPRTPSATPEETRAALLAVVEPIIGPVADEYLGRRTKTQQRSQGVL